MKKFTIGLCLFALLPQAFANQTEAIALAAAAGGVAGAAKACGQDISEFNNRVNQAIGIMAPSPAELITAMQAFQNYTNAAYTKQSTQQILPCQQVIKDYSEVPLMRNDYTTSVLPQLRNTEQRPAFLAPQQPPMEQAALQQRKEDYQQPANPAVPVFNSLQQVQGSPQTTPQVVNTVPTAQAIAAPAAPNNPNPPPASISITPP